MGTCIADVEMWRCGDVDRHVERHVERYGIVSMIRWLCAMKLLFVIIVHDRRRLELSNLTIVM